MDNVIRQLACAVTLQAVKDFADKPKKRKEILKDLRSKWMQTFTQGTSMNVAEQLEKHPKEIMARIRKDKREENNMRKALFQIDDGPVYIGYTNGDRWNGWATPYFTLEEAQKVQAEFSQGADFPMLYDATKDEFRIKYDDDEPYIWKGEDVRTVDGKLHLYGIGAYSHIWDELGKEDKLYLAQTISELLCDYDPYEWNDQDYDEYEVIDALVEQFADIDVFYKAHRIMNNATLNSDEIYEKLSEVLHI